MSKPVNTSSLKNTMFRLKAENTQLKKIVDNLPGDVYWKNKEGVWLGVNETGYRTLQTMGLVASQSEIVGKTDYQLFKKEVADVYRKHDLEVMEKGSKLLYEEINSLPSGQKVRQLSAKKPLYNDRGEIIGIIGNTLNIDNIKQLQFSLETAKEQAETASHSKTELLANMSHDLRTPLTGIIGLSKMLEETLETIKEKQYAHLINESGEQLLALLNSMLEVASADNVTESAIQQDLFDLPAAMNAVLTLQRSNAQLKNLDLRMAIDEALPTKVITDQTKLYRILLNLLGNAIKFTPAGYVALEISLLEQVGEEIRLRFSVQDTGIGISKENQAKVFERYYRIHPGQKTLYEGYGIGLHVAQKYAEALGSRIHLRSEEGKGSTFYFDLAVKKEKAEQSDDSQQIVKTPLQEVSSFNPTVSAERLHFLLVEDNRIALFFLEETIKRSGYRFTSVSNAEDALDLMTKEHFDIIITDIELPGFSGLQLSQRIREWEATHQKAPVYIIALTGHTEQEISEYNQSSINKILTKPIRPDVINLIASELIQCI